MLKKILLAIAALAILGIAVIAVAAIVTPTECKVEREITINRPQADVFEYVKKLKHQNNWGPWFKKDPAMKQEFRGNDGFVGFVSSWKSENADVGAGEQEIVRIVEGQRIDTQLRFKEPMESTADAHLVTEATGPATTKVKWGFTTSMPRPMNVMMLAVDMDALIGKDFQEGLDNLKQILETPHTVN